MKEDQQEILETTVDNLVHIFRGALVSLVPWLDKVKIGWQEPNNYDDWDSIVNNLYSNIVLRSIEYSPPLPAAEETSFLEYENSDLDFTRQSFIEVVPLPSHKTWNESFKENPVLVFYGFGTKDEPFDRVKFFPINEKGENLNEEILSLPLNGVNFQFRYRESSKNLLIVENLRVEL